MKLTKLLLVLAAGLMIIRRDSPVVAGTATANLQVSVSVNSNCTISSTAVTFSNYDPISTHATDPDDSTGGAVTVTCTKGTSANIGLDLGANFSGSQRRMKDGGATPNYINYQLFSDSGRTTEWGNASGSWLSPAPAPDKNARSFTVFGRIPGGQDVPAGTYTDTVVATVNF